MSGLEDAIPSGLSQVFASPFVQIRVIRVRLRSGVSSLVRLFPVRNPVNPVKTASVFSAFSAVNHSPLFPLFARCNTREVRLCNRLSDFVIRTSFGLRDSAFGFRE